MNRLAKATSPYLLQHKDNPVDWYPWGEEAFERAQAEDKPVFLSVGYSSCHWCHVMAHESFESDTVAVVLNEHFVSVKVDREERPDVDEAYMTAVQISSGRGGWPMSVFLTPDKKPFFAGTYFPREDRSGYPGFLNICRQIAELWKSRRDEIEKNAQEFAFGIEQALGHAAPLSNARFDQEFVNRAVQALSAEFDEVNGGFGGAPKFPPHTAIDFLLSYAQRVTGEAEQAVQLRERARHMALFTLEKMVLGGIHDHVGGGFHRYSTDAEWHLPHFEKMLYDNAMMLGNLSTAHEVADESQRSLVSQAVTEIFLWLTREMTSADGCYYSALDADSEGEEGKFYVWTMDEVRNLLTAEEALYIRGLDESPNLQERAESFLSTFDLRSEGNFRDEATGRFTGANVLHRQSPNSDPDSFLAELMLLRHVREKTRARPGLDTKALIGWNGLAIGAQCSHRINKSAFAAADAILLAEEVHGQLPHQIANGKPSGEAFLEDYAAFAYGLWSMARVLDRPMPHLADDPAEAVIKTQKIRRSYPPERYRDHAKRLTRNMIDRFWDEEHGGFFSTSTDHETLFGRTKPVFDQPIPSGNALALRCLIEIGDVDRARKLLDWATGWMERAPQATEALYSAALSLLDVANPPSAREPSTVNVTIEPEELATDPQGHVAGHVVLDIPKDLHINSNSPAEEWLVPTTVSIDGLDADVRYPATGDGMYRGTVRIPFSLVAPANTTVAIRVMYQTCTDYECLLPAEDILSVAIRSGNNH